MAYIGEPRRTIIVEEPVKAPDWTRVVAPVEQPERVLVPVKEAKGW